MDELQTLIDKLRRVEALHARTNFDGEREAAASVIDSIRQRIADYEKEDPPVHYKFTVADGWSGKLLKALLRRYGIEPYRFFRQRRTTIMARVSQKFVDETLWPQFCELSDMLEEYLNDVTDRVIRSAIHQDDSDITSVHASAGIPHVPK